MFVVGPPGFEPGTTGSEDPGTYKGMSQELIIIWDRTDKNSYYLVYGTVAILWSDYYSSESKSN